ncbi:histidine kinase [Muricauda sp. SCSIO 64092]|uniref:sensor histidine kinase n=1 Tax=Allomuricauda sp. SCSIO 64092 TaxID=2908842 RepID=UPI001FF3B53F|nr:histidine kinase [Muricauda sp. SCSIO 64092]UOY08274.1 histidine kinase [Muricauda sp. SCSIO 64092]
MQETKLRFNRLYLYSLLCLFSIALIAIVKVMIGDSVKEVLLQTIILFPLMFSYIYLVYTLRKAAFRSKTYQMISDGNRFVKVSFFGVFVLVKALLTSILLRWVVLVLFDDDGSDTFDLGFLAIFAASLMTIVFVYTLESFLEGEMDKVALKERMQKYEHDRSLSKYLTLKKQVNPHFLFNSFNSLAGLISSDRKNAENFLQELSSIYRYTLKHEDEVVVKLEDEVKLIRSYMRLQDFRHKGAIELTMEIDPHMAKWLLPPMTLELLLENALKHNEFEKGNPLHISVRTYDKYVVVSNDYRPKAQVFSKDSLGLGIRNLKSQYDFISNVKPTFQVIDRRYMAKIPLIQPEFD